MEGRDLDVFYWVIKKGQVEGRHKGNTVEVKVTWRGAAAWRGVVMWLGVTWCDVAWYDVVRCGVVWG